MQHCSNCKYAEKIPAENLGEQSTVRCRRYPPQILAVPAQNQITQQAGVTIMPMFPQLAESEYCGEWQPADLDS